MGVAYDKPVCANICTASEKTAERLHSMLLRWADSECVALYARWTQHISPRSQSDTQLVILDVDTVDLPEKTPPRDDTFGLIAISGDAARAICAYRLHPTAFLKSDFDLPGLADALTVCEKYWAQGRIGLGAPYRRRSFRLPLGNIRYIEAEAHYCRFNQGKTEIRLRFSIDELERLLPAPPFIRCHRSFMVHLGAVAGMTYTTVTLRGSESLPLGRTYVRILRSALQAWQRGEKRDDSFGLDL